MTAIDIPSSRAESVRARRLSKLVLAAPARTYCLIIAVVALAAFAYSLRYQGIFSCQASGYGADRYLAYCQATSYSDYDHGAFWFGLEPEAVDAARNADVLFLGNSRMQFGL